MRMIVLPGELSRYRLIEAEAPMKFHSENQYGSRTSTGDTARLAHRERSAIDYAALQWKHYATRCFIWDLTPSHLIQNIDNCRRPEWQG
jgi:hypothetical protein